VYVAPAEYELVPSLQPVNANPARLNAAADETVNVSPIYLFVSCVGVVPDPLFSE
jgi:hypothetical protein